MSAYFCPTPKRARMGFKKLSGLRYVVLKYEKSESDGAVGFPHSSKSVVLFL